MVTREDGLKAVKYVIYKNGGTYGFEILWENERFDLSIEALVLRPEYHEMFTEKVREICINRLKEFGYEIC